MVLDKEVSQLDDLASVKRTIGKGVGFSAVEKILLGRGDIVNFKVGWVMTLSDGKFT